jgi:predicted DsbA family dithiol-disulfide isomerase
MQQKENIEIIYYTDPLCCWSWAMEPQWRQLQEELGSSLNVTYKMAGLLPSWKNFNDTINSIRKPIHMGPEWMHAKYVSGVDIDNRIWITDPPASSFPACIAVKSAELQSKEAGVRYLDLLREAVMLKVRNIARMGVLLELAAELPAEFPAFDLSMFRSDLNGKALDAFRADWQETKYRGITRFPTLVIKAGGRQPFVLSGFQSYETLKNATVWIPTILPEPGK